MAAGKSEVGLGNIQSNKDIPTGSTRSVPSQTSVNIFNNRVEINKNVEKSLTTTFTGDTNLRRMIKMMRMSLSATSETLTNWNWFGEGRKELKTVFYFQQVSDTKLQLQLHGLQPIKLLYSEGFRKLQWSKNWRWEPELSLRTRTMWFTTALDQGGISFSSEIQHCQRKVLKNKGRTAAAAKH